jgi:hypothetical protein
MPKILLQANGTENMGDVTNPNSICRFTMKEDRWHVVYIRWKVTKLSGDGGNANLAFYIDRKHITGLHIYLLGTMRDMGDPGDLDMNLRIMPFEAEHWTFRRGDELVLTWTNPDSGNMQWEVEVELSSGDA